jgi:hypothetical protein
MASAWSPALVGRCGVRAIATRAIAGNPRGSAPRSSMGAVISS